MPRIAVSLSGDQESTSSTRGPQRRIPYHYVPLNSRHEEKYQRFDIHIAVRQLATAFFNQGCGAASSPALRFHGPRLISKAKKTAASCRRTWAPGWRRHQAADTPRRPHPQKSHNRLLPKDLFRALRAISQATSGLGVVLAWHLIRSSSYRPAALLVFPATATWTRIIASRSGRV